MDYKDIASKSPADLEKLLAEKREALRTFRFNTSGGKIKNVKEGYAIRKEIARILTAKKALAKGGSKS